MNIVDIDSLNPPTPSRLSTTTTRQYKKMEVFYIKSFQNLFTYILFLE